MALTLLSAVRPVGKIATDLTARFIARTNTRLKRCLSNQDDLRSAGVKVSVPTFTSTECSLTDDNRGYVSESRRNSDIQVSNVNLIPLAGPDIGGSLSESYLDDQDVTLPKPLDRCNEDLSDVGPNLTPTFTFAKYANESLTVQELVKLGVKLYKLESKTDMVQYILGLDFEHQVKPYIRFLHDCRVPADYIGEFITRNPNIFKEDMDDLRTRIRYMRAHEFTINMIKNIICSNPKWLSFSTKDIDGRLGYFQSNFKLNGSEVRCLVLKGPKVITYNMMHLMGNTFGIKEEMGFDKYQAKELLLRLPRLWVKSREKLVNVFDYVHNTMQLQHDIVVKSPQILLCRKTRLQRRHMFLVELKLAQYNPTKPLYVSPIALVSGTDVEFCRNVAKTSVDVYNAFLKTF